jgi:hypothetical protein
MQNSFGPQPPNFGGWQGNGWRRTGCTPTDVNAASRQKTVVEACVPLSTEGIILIIPVFKRIGNKNIKIYWILVEIYIFMQSVSKEE